MARKRTEGQLRRQDQSTLTGQTLEQFRGIGEFREDRKPQPDSFDGEGISSRDDQSGNEQSGRGEARPTAEDRHFEAEHDRHYCKDDR